jgi:hypothetical protein
MTRYGVEEEVKYWRQHFFSRKGSVRRTYQSLARTPIDAIRLKKGI